MANAGRKKRNVVAIAEIQGFRIEDQSALVYNILMTALDEKLKPAEEIVQDSSGAQPAKLEDAGPFAQVSVDAQAKPFTKVEQHIPNVPVTDGAAHAKEGALGEDLIASAQEEKALTDQDKATLLSPSQWVSVRPTMVYRNNPFANPTNAGEWLIIKKNRKVSV